MRVAFGDCVLDSETRELTRDGQAVHLSPKSFRLLELLLVERTRALSNEESRLHAKWDSGLRPPAASFRA